MYYQEHNPPHFHVRYNEYKAAISIKDLALLDGKLPPKVFSTIVCLEEIAGLYNHKRKNEM